MAFRDSQPHTPKPGAQGKKYIPSSSARSAMSGYSSGYSETSKFDSLSAQSTLSGRDSKSSTTTPLTHRDAPSCATKKKAKGFSYEKHIVLLNHALNNHDAQSYSGSVEELAENAKRLVSLSPEQVKELITMINENEDANNDIAHLQLASCIESKCASNSHIDCCCLLIQKMLIIGTKTEVEKRCSQNAMRLVQKIAEKEPIGGMRIVLKQLMCAQERAELYFYEQLIEQLTFEDGTLFALHRLLANCFTSTSCRKGDKTQTFIIERYYGIMNSFAKRSTSKEQLAKAICAVLHIKQSAYAKVVIKRATQELENHYDTRKGTDDILKNEIHRLLNFSSPVNINQRVASVRALRWFAEKRQFVQVVEEIDRLVESNGAYDCAWLMKAAEEAHECGNELNAAQLLARKVLEKSAPTLRLIATMRGEESCEDVTNLEKLLQDAIEALRTLYA